MAGVEGGVVEEEGRFVISVLLQVDAGVGHFIEVLAEDGEGTGVGRAPVSKEGADVWWEGNVGLSLADPNAVCAVLDALAELE